jgi:hypothetical protein
LMGERKRMSEVVKIAGWREAGEEEEEMGSRKRLTSLGVRYVLTPDSSYLELGSP